jgi:hypothetical protein
LLYELAAGEGVFYPVCNASAIPHRSLVNLFARTQEWLSRAVSDVQLAQWPNVG